MTAARRVATAAALVLALLILGPYLVILAAGVALAAGAVLERAGLL